VDKHFLQRATLQTFFATGGRIYFMNHRIKNFSKNLFTLVSTKRRQKW